MSEYELPSLLAEHRRLVDEEAIIKQLLKRIREEIHALQIEQLQLDSMIMTEDGNVEKKSNISTAIAVASDMDSAEEVNKEILNLAVSSSLIDMLKGQFYTEEEEEEEEDEDDDEEGTGTQPTLDEEEFILPL